MKIVYRFYYVKNYDTKLWFHRKLWEMTAQYSRGDRTSPFSLISLPVCRSFTQLQHSFVSAPFIEPSLQTLVNYRLHIFLNDRQFAPVHK